MGYSGKDLAGAMVRDGGGDTGRDFENNDGKGQRALPVLASLVASPK